MNENDDNDGRTSHSMVKLESRTIDKLTSNIDVDRNRDEIKPMNDQHFEEIILLPIYYNNVRSITNKYNVCTKIDLSTYKVLIMTETNLSEKESSSVYFPNKFNVHRFDRPSTNISRRSGGVGILVHRELHHHCLNLKGDAECEFVAIKINLKPVSLIIYAVYMKVFDLEVAMKHLVIIKRLTLEYLEHRIMVIGDFNILRYEW